MTADDFCKQYVDDALNGRKSVLEFNGNTHYHGDIFYSYKMPICQHFRTDLVHYFEIVEKDESPSRTTTKHITKLLNAIQSECEHNINISITYVQEIIKREKRNELD